MLQATKRMILGSLRRRGYELLKASDPRLEPRRVNVDTALASLNEHAVSEQQAGSIFDRVLQDLVVPRHRGVTWGDRMLTLDRSVAFRDDPRFQKAMRDCSSSTGENQYSSPDGIAWRLNTLIWAARCALKIPGDFVECGVFEGDMSWVVTEMVDLDGAQKTFYLGLRRSIRRRPIFRKHPSFLIGLMPATAVPAYMKTCDAGSSRSRTSRSLRA